MPPEDGDGEGPAEADEPLEADEQPLDAEGQPVAAAEALEDEEQPLDADGQPVAAPRR